jgi:hypothetical protein
MEVIMSADFWVILGISNLEVSDYVMAGNTLKKPANCPGNVFEIMQSCWIKDPSMRPDFKNLTKKINMAFQEENSQKVANEKVTGKVVTVEKPSGPIEDFYV